MAYTLVINNTYTFAVTPSRFPDINYNWKASGEQVSAEEKWPLHCFLVSDSTTTLISYWAAFKTLIEHGSPMKVEWLLNGTPIEMFDLSNCNNTPRFENIRSVEYGGGFVNHIEFTMDVVMVRAIKWRGIVNISETIEETTDKEGHSTTITIRGVGNNARVFVLSRLNSAIASYGNPSSITYRTDTFDNAFEVMATLKKEDDSGGGGGEGGNEEDSAQGWRETYTLRQAYPPIRQYPLGLKKQAPPYLIAGGLPCAELSCEGHFEYIVVTKIKVQPPPKPPIIVGDPNPPNKMYKIDPISAAAHTFQIINKGVFTSNEVRPPYIQEFAAAKVPSVWGMDYNWSMIIPTIEHIDVKSVPKPRL